MQVLGAEWTPTAWGLSMLFLKKFQDFLNMF
jgi:hypothetical protein